MNDILSVNNLQKQAFSYAKIKAKCFPNPYEMVFFNSINVSN